MPETQDNRQILQIIRRGLINLDREVKKMSKDEIEIEKPYEMIDAVTKNFEYYNEEQGEHGLKVLTPQQMLSRLPISLAHLNAGNKE